VAAAGGPGERALRAAMHRSIGRVTEDVERFQFNTAISAVMELVNATMDYRRDKPAGSRDLALLREAGETVTLLLSPVAPHMGEELWRVVLGHEGSVHRAQWPDFDPSAVVMDEVEIPVQVNGKVRDRLTVPVDIDEESLKAAALALPNVAAHIAGLTVRKVVVVPGKLVSIVAG
jgi:leucyl-tRNA synthetase